MGPNLIHRPAGLGRRHLYPQVRRAGLAEPFARVPTTFLTDPRGAARALDEIIFQFFHGLKKSIVVSHFPGRRTGAPPQVGRSPKHPAKQTAGRIQSTGNRSNRRWLKTSAVTGATPVTVKFKLKALIGTEVRIVSRELDLVHGVFPFALCFRFLESLEGGWLPS
jgi:hypothetical protein